MVQNNKRKKLWLSAWLAPSYASEVWQAEHKSKAITHDEIKDLQKAIKDNGLGSPYFKQLLKGIYGNYDLIPSDCHYVSSIILMDSQYVLWDLKWRRLLNRLIKNYAGGANAALTIAHLAGSRPHNRAEDQAVELPRVVLADIKDAASKAILQIQLAGSPEGVYTQRRQGMSEPFTTFIDHLTQAIERQSDEDLVLPRMLVCFVILPLQMLMKNVKELFVPWLIYSQTCLGWLKLVVK